MPELTLKKENISNLKDLFLGLEINIKYREFETELNGKRDAFPFCIARMPYQDSNVPIRIFYAAVGSESLRLARKTSSQERFQKLINTLTRMQRQGCQN